MHFKSAKERLDYNNEGFKRKNNYFSFKNKNMDCLYEGCKCKAVNSHSISKKSSLISISENNEVLICKPIRDKEECTFSFKPVGINEASTFKGFCSDHEKLFERLDNGKIENLKDLLLQIYRGIGYACYNSGVMRVLESQQKDRMRKYYKFNELKSKNNSLYKSLDEIIEKTSKNKVSEFYRLKKVMGKYIELINSLDDSKNRAIMDNDRFEDELINHIIRFKRVNKPIPVAVLNNFNYNVSEKSYDIFFMVIPYENSTDIIMVIERDPKISCEEYWEKVTESNIKILNFIETLMMMSEFWFIKPSIINTMSKERQKIIENDIWFATERKQFEPYDMSIFDEIRKEFLYECDEETTDRELSKIYTTPFRENLEDRKRKMHEEMNKQYTNLMAMGRSN